MEATPSPTDRDAFEALVLRHQAAICAIAYAVLRDRARSEEVAQDALLIAWRDRAKVTVTAGWICGIARNLARNAARRRREVVMDREPATDVRDARESLIAREDIAHANDALARLPEKYRDAVAIYYRSDESYAEVAAALGITEASARQRVHRGRERLQERLSIVETTLRKTRPGVAFTAAVIAAWAMGRSASAATVTASKATWLVPVVGLGAIASTVAIAVAIRTASADRETHETRTSTALHEGRNPTRRFPLMARATSAPALPTLPPGFTPASAPTGTLSPATTATVSFDFQQVPLEHLMQVIADEAETPIWSMIEPDNIDIRVQNMPVLQALDQILADAHATRTEVEAIRIVDHGSTTAASLGGEPMSLSVRAVPINDVLKIIEARLAIPISRVQPVRSNAPDGRVIEAPTAPVTLEITNAPAGLVLQRVLEQTGYGYELTTGFVITPG